MSGISEEQLIAAIKRAVPDHRDMTQGDIVEFLADHPESLREALVAVGAVEKSDPEPTDMLDGFYRGGESQTTTVSPEIAKAVNKRFPSQPDVEVRDPSESLTLGIHYGSQVDSPAATEGGDYFPEDSD